MSANTGKWSDQWSVQQRQLARELVTKALKTGALVRQPCEVFGAPYALAYHENYDQQPLAVERGPQVGHWREIGTSKPVQSGKPAFDLSKYKKPQAPNEGKYPQAEEELFPDQQTDSDTAKGPTEPHGSDGAGF